MIKYAHGEKYKHHCNGLERIGIVLITCDPGVQRVSYVHENKLLFLLHIMQRIELAAKEVECFSLTVLKGHAPQNNGFFF